MKVQINSVAMIKQQLSLDTDLSSPCMGDCENRFTSVATSNIHGQLWHTEETVMKGTINMTHIRFPKIAASLNPISSSPVGITTSTILSGRSKMNMEGKVQVGLATGVGSWQCLQL